jgi:hypothetical protein
VKGPTISSVGGGTEAAPRATGPAQAHVGAAGSIRAWWDGLTRPTKLVLSVNGVVVAGVGALAALLKLTA